jgi:NADH-quinone oxidoreductase subunit M
MSWVRIPPPQNIIVLYMSLCIALSGILIIVGIREGEIGKIKKAGLICSLLILSVSLGSLLSYNRLVFVFQEQKYINTLWFTGLNSTLKIGIDSISLYFILLSSFLIVLSILCGWENVKYRAREYILLLLITEILLLCFFSVQDILTFYIIFESLLIPMFLLIGMWGSRERRMHAAYQFFLYTLTGSLIMLLGIIMLYYSIGGTDMVYIKDLNKEGLSLRNKCIWITFFIALSVKIPMVPLHIWLPEAHVEAPTGGSVLLAGILLKMGGYGFLRLIIPLGMQLNAYFTPLVYTISVIGILYTSLITLRQVDMKKIIAYSSIGHMNYVTLGIFSNNVQGIVGSIFLMLSHGFVSSGLFLSVGVLYDRYKTRLITNYGGIVQIMPIFSILFFILILANIGFPGTSSFMGEMLVLMGLVKIQLVVVFLSFLSVILSAIYSMWCFNRVIFGVLGNYSKYCDVTKREFFILSSLIVLIIVLGIHPMSIVDTLQYNVSRIML